MFSLTSFLFFGASFKKFKWMTWVFHAILMMRLFSGINLVDASLFTVINFLTIVLLPIILKSLKVGNNISSILVPLIWSVIIDTVSYAMFPTSLSYLTYVWNGIVFNYKGIIMPAIIVVGFSVIELYFTKKEKKLTHEII